MGNNPVAGVDPDGQFWQQVGIGALIGAMNGAASGLAAGHSGWDLAKDIGGGAVVGALSGGVGAWAGGLGAAGGTLGGSMGVGAVSGMAAGAVSGMGMAALYGRDIADGGVRGAALGALSGAIGGAFGYANASAARKAMMGKMLLSGEQGAPPSREEFAEGFKRKIKFEMSKDAKQYDLDVKRYVRAQRSLESTAAQHHGSNFATTEPMGLNGNNRFMFQSGVVADGYTVRDEKGIPQSYYSPFAVDQGRVYFNSVLGHEIIHQHHFLVGLDVGNEATRSFSERSAYNWTADYWKAAGNEALYNKALLLGQQYGPTNSAYEYSPFSYY